MRTFGTREWIATAIAVVAAVILFYGNSIWNYIAGGETVGAPTDQPSNTIQPSANPEAMTNISTTPGLEIYDESVGTGAEAVAGKNVTVHYIGVFTNGDKFDSSVDRGTPFTFPLGAGNVIKGWDIGVEGMKVGGIRRLVIPADLAYGPNDYNGIPGGSTLIFQVQLLGVE